MGYQYIISPLARRNVRQFYMLRRKPTIECWKGYHMANADKWYYAYIILDDVIVVVDACHAKNMYNK